MARLFVPAEKLTGDALTLEAEDHRYLTKVLRLGCGDELTIFDGRGHEIEARIEEVGRRATRVALGARRQVALPGSLAITLIQSVPRGDRMDWIVQKVTELGVGRIVPVTSGRSVVRPPGRSARWRTIAREAARQSGRADVPDVEAPVALDAALAEAGSRDAHRFVLWEGTRGRPLRAMLSGGGTGMREVVLLVGPEGGFAAAEVAQAEAHGFVPVGLGPRILRVETAAVVAVALVQAGAGGLD